MTTDPLWITEAEVVSLMDLGDAITAVGEGLRTEGSGDATNMVKTQAHWPGGTLHSLGGALTSGGLVGAKSWAHVAGGQATPLLTLWHAGTGQLAAVIEAFALGQYRTAALAGFATSLMAAPRAHVLAMMGTGAQALTQAGAVVAVRPIDHIRVYGRDGERRDAFAQKCRNAFNVEVVSCSSVAAAADGAEVLTLITRATSAFLQSDMVAAGAHVNAMGAIGTERAEFEAKLLGRCATVASDSPAQARAFSSELREHYGTDPDGWGDVQALSQLALSPPLPPEGDDISLFKGMGVGLADVALGAFCLRKAVENRIGLPLSPPERSRPRLRSSLQHPGVGYV